MPVSLNFDSSHRYASTDGIEVPIELRVGNRKVELFARLDIRHIAQVFAAGGLSSV
jgi:hypothetical protein